MNFSNNIKFLTKHGIEISEADFADNASKTVVVGMSGGVDSSVCALICKMMGFNTIGIFMKNWEELDENGHCTSEQDYADVVSVCEKVNIPYYSLNFVEEYKNNVFDFFLKEYQKGNTPNPDILCNREIKFKVFFEKAMEFGADFLATGHYCQINKKDGEIFLQKGKDNNKDQSYFLHAISGEVLEKVLFPIGHLEKPKVREIAHEYDLITKGKKDSTGICFIGERNFKNFLSTYVKEQAGNFVNLENGKEIMPHSGHCFYTIGQRKGLGIGGPGGPWFVAKKDKEKNVVYVVEGENHPALYADGLIAEDMTWLTRNRPQFPLRCKAKIRYRQKDQACKVELEQDKLKVVFDHPQRAMAVGQSIVFYKDDICLGGAVITNPGQTYFELNKSLPVF